MLHFKADTIQGGGGGVLYEVICIQSRMKMAEY